MVLRPKQSNRCYNGGGGGHFGRGSSGAVVGSDEGGAPAVSRVEGGHREAGRTCACKAVGAAVAVWPD
jgi:hypothetical protein